MTSASRALLILTSLNLLDYLDRYLIAALGSLVKKEMDLSDTAFGFLGTAFFLVYFISAPIFGYLGDRWGRRRLMAGGAALWSLITGLTYFVGSYPALVATRGLVAVGEASFSTQAPAYFADILPQGQRARALGLFYLALPIGTALAYLVGALIGSRWGWRTAFLLAGFPGLIMALLIYRLPRTALPKDSPTARQDPSKSSPFAVPWYLWRIPSIRRVTLGFGMITFTLGGLAFWMPRYLELAKGLTLPQANLLLFGCVILGGGLGAVSGGYLGDRLLTYTQRAPLWVSGGSIVLALPLSALLIYSVHPFFYIPALAGATFLLFMNPGVLTSVVVSVAGPGRRAQAVALTIVVIHLVGDVPSPFLIGWISDLGGLRWGVSLIMTALVAAALLVFSALPHLRADLAAAEDLSANPAPGNLSTT